MAEIIYVNIEASGNNDGSSWDNAYRDLQDAIAAAQDGDQIWVADGTYKPTDGQDRSISFRLKSEVAIYGGFSGDETNLEARNFQNNQTILSGNLGVLDDDSDNSYHVVDASNTNSRAILDGFLITGGNANGEDSFEDGGGIYSDQGNAEFSNLTIFGNTTEGRGGGFYTTEPTSPDVENSHRLTNVIFRNNTAVRSSGGGLYNNGSGLFLENVQFVENTADQSGAGLYNRVSNPVILNNVEFINNQANSGGGLFNNDNRDDDLRLTNVRFINNQAERFGGGFYNFAGSPILTDVEFINNTSNEEGGAIRVGLGSPIITNSLFRSNSAVSGGAIFVSTDERETRIINGVFDRNRADSGGAIYIDESNTTIINSTFAGNEAGDGAAVFSLLEGEQRPTVTNSIFYNNQGNAIANQGGTTVVNNSLVQGGYQGDNNLDTDPLFVDSENGDLRLVENSPGVDVGNNAVVEDSDPTNPPRDIAGNLRLFNEVVDLGAYEYSEPYLSVNDPQVVVNVASGELDTTAEVTFNIRLTDSNGQLAPQESSVSIDYITANNTAVVDEDYVSATGTATFAPGETEQTVTIPIFNNTETEETESFYLELSNLTGDILDFDTRGIATIVAESEPPTVANPIADVVEEQNAPDRIIDLSGVFEDADSDNIELEVVNNSNSELVTPLLEGNDLTLDFLDNQFGTADITIRATADGKFVEDTFTVTVNSILNNPINRFQNEDIPGTYLFADEAESQNIRDNFPNFQEEGFAFNVADEPGENLIPLYRFQSLITPGTYLFADEAERSIIKENFSESFFEEGLAFYVYAVGSDKGTEFTRFQNSGNPGTYLFADPEEAESIRNNFPSFIEEGAAFEVVV